MASVRYELVASSPPGPSRRWCARSWSSCTATVWARRVRCAFTRPTAPTPCRLCQRTPIVWARDIRGIGFKTADAIAMQLGVDRPPWSLQPLSGDELTTAARQGQKNTASQDQAGQASADDGAGHCRRAEYRDAAQTRRAGIQR